MTVQSLNSGMSVPHLLCNLQHFVYFGDGGGFYFNYWQLITVKSFWLILSLSLHTLSNNLIAPENFVNHTHCPSSLIELHIFTLFDLRATELFALIKYEWKENINFDLCFDCLMYASKFIFFTFFQHHLYT